MMGVCLDRVVDFLNLRILIFSMKINIWNCKWGVRRMRPVSAIEVLSRLLKYCLLHTNYSRTRI